MAAAREKRRQERRDRALSERDERRAALYARFPRLREIAEERARAGREIVRLALAATAGTAAVAGTGQLEQRMRALAAEERALLAQNKLPPDALEVRWTCQKCQDTGWLQDGDPTGSTLPPAQKCSCRLEEEVEGLYHASNIRGPQRAFTFAAHNASLWTGPEDRAVAGELFSRCRAFAAGVVAGTQRESLVLMGDVGRGKTFFASAIANAVLQAHKLALYFTFAEFLQFARASKFEGEEYQIWQETLQAADVAILDDLGTEVVTDFVKAELFNVLNARLGSGKPMVVCTNLTVAQIGDAYATRIASRLIGAAEILQIAGPDLREVLRRRAQRSAG